MKAHEEFLIDFLSVYGRRFIIPLYQRNYDWKRENCKQLFDDIENLIDKDLRSHFFGSIVFQLKDSDNFILIDGQQRITTISLLLLALLNYSKNEKIDDDFDEEKINMCLETGGKDTKEKIKLKIIKKDEEAYKNLFSNDSSNYLENSKLTQNYDYLYKRITESKCTVSQIFNAIRKLEIVKIELEYTDNPQLVFESMNSTGLDLKEADKIRNFILMDKNYDKQVELYENYWNKIENNVGFDTTDFIRDYLTIKMQKVPNFSKIYKTFKEDFIVGKNIDVDEALNEMLEYSKIYNYVRNENSSEKDINKYFKVFNYLKYSLLYPYLMQILEHNIDGEISKEQVLECYKTLETFIIRRIICRKPTNALQKGFCNLDNDVVNLIKKRNLDMSYYDSIYKFILLNKKGSMMFPLDDEFEEQFKIIPLFELHSQPKNYVLESLENYNTKEQIVTLTDLDDKKFSIEHIMPQTLSPDWKKSLGVNFEEIYNKYLHTIGNLTITAYNSEYKNKPFLEKRDMKNGFKDSKLHLNTDLSKIDQWTENEIIERAEKLSKEALNVWKMPETKFQDADYITKYSLSDEDTDFTGEKINSYSFDGTNYPVSSWKDFMIQLISYLCEIDKIPMLNLIEKQKNEKFIFVSDEKEKIRKPKEITSGIFIETNCSTETILNNIRKVLNEYEIDFSEVEFELKEKNK